MVAMFVLAVAFAISSSCSENGSDHDQILPTVVPIERIENGTAFPRAIRRPPKATIRSEASSIEAIQSIGSSCDGQINDFFATITNGEELVVSSGETLRFDTTPSTIVREATARTNETVGATKTLRESGIVAWSGLAQDREIDVKQTSQSQGKFVAPPLQGRYVVSIHLDFDPECESYYSFAIRVTE